MSIDIQILIERQQMLSPTDWQAAIESRGLPMQLLYDFNIETYRGYLPCLLEGREYGFEYRFQPLEKDGPSEGEDDSNAHPCLIALSVPAGSPPKRIQVAALVAAVLAQKSHGILRVNQTPVDADRQLQEQIL